MTRPPGKRQKRMMSLRQVRNEAEVCRMPRDGFHQGDFWMSCDGHSVSLVNQKLGESPTQSITLPKGLFDRFVDRYTRPVVSWQPKAPKKRKVK